MLKKIFIVVLVLILAGIGTLFLLPSDYAVREAIDANGDPALYHTCIEDLSTWKEWSAWNAEKYPEMTHSFSEKTSGKGAWWAWKDPTGDGKMTITESSLEKGMTYSLEFAGFEPSTGHMIVRPQEDGTLRISMSLNGDLPFFMSWARGIMEEEMAKEFKKGLEGLVARIEKN